MRSISRFVAGVATLLAAGPVLATPSLSCDSATMVRSGTNPTTGHYFEVYAIDGVSWDFANACANASHLFLSFLRSLNSFSTLHS